jgi:hypothetical protein
MVRYYPLQSSKSGAAGDGWFFTLAMCGAGSRPDTVIRNNISALYSDQAISPMLFASRSYSLLRARSCISCRTSVAGSFVSQLMSDQRSDTRQPVWALDLLAIYATDALLEL